MRKIWKCLLFEGEERKCVLFIQNVKKKAKMIKELFVNISSKLRWSSGRIIAYQAIGSGSIPGRSIFFVGF